MKEEVIARKVPTAKPTETVSHVLNFLAKEKWDDIETVYVISKDTELLGMIPIHNLLIAQKSEVMSKIMDHVKLKVGPHVDQEKLVIDAIHKDVTSVPVVDHENRLLGAVTADRIIDILHEEHLEDLLRFSGIRGEGAMISELITAKLKHVIIARLPWIIVGLGVGLVASLVVSQFEDFLNKNVALAFFISMIAYMSDAVGTQSETLFIRSLTVARFNMVRYLVRELAVGVIMGSVVGVFAGIAAFVISNSIGVAFAVGISLLLSMSFATILACIVPLGLKSLGKDPAIGSGPFATALQDFLSITIYFVTALLILGA
jgi:magnesium transporter